MSDTEEKQELTDTDIDRLEYNRRFFFKNDLKLSEKFFELLDDPRRDCVTVPQLRRHIRIAWSQFIADEIAREAETIGTLNKGIDERIKESPILKNFEEGTKAYSDCFEEQLAENYIVPEGNNVHTFKEIIGCVEETLLFKVISGVPVVVPRTSIERLPAKPNQRVDLFEFMERYQWAPHLDDTFNKPSPNRNMKSNAKLSHFQSSFYVYKGLVSTGYYKQTGARMVKTMNTMFDTQSTKVASMHSFFDMIYLFAFPDTYTFTSPNVILCINGLSRLIYSCWTNEGDLNISNLTRLPKDILRETVFASDLYGIESLFGDSVDKSLVHLFAPSVPISLYMEGIYYEDPTLSSVLKWNTESECLSHIEFHQETDNLFKKKRISVVDGEALDYTEYFKRNCEAATHHFHKIRTCKEDEVDLVFAVNLSQLMFSPSGRIGPTERSIVETGFLASTFCEEVIDFGNENSIEGLPRGEHLRKYIQAMVPIFYWVQYIRVLAYLKGRSLCDPTFDPSKPEYKAVADKYAQNIIDYYQNIYEVYYQRKIVRDGIIEQMFADHPRDDFCQLFPLENNYVYIFTMMQTFDIIHRTFLVQE